MFDGLSWKELEFLKEKEWKFSESSKSKGNIFTFRLCFVACEKDMSTTQEGIGGAEPHGKASFWLKRNDKWNI